MPTPACKQCLMSTLSIACIVWNLMAFLKQRMRKQLNVEPASEKCIDVNISSCKKRTPRSPVLAVTHACKRFYQIWSQIQSMTQERARNDENYPNFFTVQIRLGCSMCCSSKLQHAPKILKHTEQSVFIENYRSWRTTIAFEVNGGLTDYHTSGYVEKINARNWGLKVEAGGMKYSNLTVWGKYSWTSIIRSRRVRGQTTNYGGLRINKGRTL